jgi:hypothetical protein
MAMHQTFLVLPRQIEIVEKFYETHVYAYLRSELKALQMDLEETSQHVVQKISKVAEKNTSLYDLYEEKVEEQEQELRRLRQQLLASVKNNAKGHKDAGKILSETEHTQSTADTDEDCSENEDDLDDSPTGFLKVTKILLTPTEKLTSIGHNINNMRMAMTKQFQLPFGN